MNNADLIVATLKAAGITRGFGIPSGNVLPLIHRAKVAAVNGKLKEPPSGWDNDLWSLPEWYKEA